MSRNWIPAVIDCGATPKSLFFEEDECWYTQKPVDVNALQKFLPNLSKVCGLSQIYTNHTLRATNATVLHRAHHSPVEIQAVTGHKSLSSLAIYQRTSTQQKMLMGDTLAEKVIVGTEQVETQQAPASHAVSKQTATVVAKQTHSADIGEVDELQNITANELDFIFSKENE